MTRLPRLLHAYRHPLATWTERMLHVLTVVLLALASSTSSAAAATRISVSPQNSTVEVGASKQFTASVSFSPNTVSWEVNGIKGGNAMVGTITASGLYTPPAVIPSVNTVTIGARSTSRTTVVGTTKLTITRPVPVLSSVTPTSFPVGAYVEVLNGSKFASDSQVLVNGVAVKTTFVSASQLKAEGSTTAAGTLSFAVRQPAPGSVTSNSLTATVVATTNVTVAVAPTAVTLPLGGMQGFTGTLTGTSDASLTWSVNGIAGGSSAVGTISASGVYTAPLVMPASPAVTVKATSVASPTASASATVTLQAPVAIVLTPTTTSIALGASQTFVAKVTGSANTGVTWMVNGVAGGASTTGTITAGGVYTAPTSMPASSVVTVRAVAAADTTVSAQASVTLTSSTMTSPTLSAARFLEQASFGPTPASLARVKQIGINAYLDEQLNMPPTPIPDLTGRGPKDLSNWMLFNYTQSPDQLRQRVSYSLSQILVTSQRKLGTTADESLPWLRLLNDNAFGNYRDLLRQMSVSPSMAKYLDLANSMKAGLAGGANENFPRELMQLFTIGLVKLNQDGSVVLGADGQPVPTYTQDTVREVARALTGWTYATAPGATPKDDNWEYFAAPLETRPNSHDTGAKSFLGCNAPAGQSVEQDLDTVIDCVMAHPNVPPFIATRLIRSLVMSNPSPAYIKRVADVFAGTTTGVRGDLRATVRAILLDPEARQDTPTATGGRLKEPILQLAGFLRALNGGFMDGSGLTYLFENMGQGVLAPPTVFSWFSPLFHLPDSTTFGPEFQIYSPSESVQKGNFIYALLANSMGSSGSGYTLDLSPFQPYGDDMPGLVEAVNQTFHYGRMPAEMKQALITAAGPGDSATTRIITAVYLSALSGQYAVQY